MWRWDQGRLAYFTVHNVEKIAHSLCKLNGVSLEEIGKDHLRDELEKNVGLPFAAPETHTVWRNYRGVFKVLGLASKIDDKLAVTQLCKQLATAGEDKLSQDDYLEFMTKAFYYPFPSFNNYNTTEFQTYPFICLIKYLISKRSSSEFPSMTVDDALSVLVGNEVTGMEPISHYATLERKEIPNGVSARQVREMFIFISQLSYLNWSGSALQLDASTFQNLDDETIEKLLVPNPKERFLDKEEEVQNIFSQHVASGTLANSSTEPFDMKFTEGKKIRVNHLKTERNKKVIQYYFKNSDAPQLCNLCQQSVVNNYPWMNNLIEVHHLLPLSSPVHLNKGGTSLSDLVGLCPNCHRATHAYYRQHLKEAGLDDFTSEEQAKEVYQRIKDVFTNS